MRVSIKHLSKIASNENEVREAIPVLLFCVLEFSILPGKKKEPADYLSAGSLNCLNISCNLGSFPKAFSLRGR